MDGCRFDQRCWELCLCGALTRSSMTTAPTMLRSRSIVLGSYGMSMEDNLALAVEAEGAGLHALCVGDAEHDTFSLLSAFAAITRRIRLVSTVATWTRTPLTTVRAARTMDLLSGGRYVLGLGSMPPYFNEDLHGIPFKAPMQRMAEYLELIRLLWEASPDRPVTYEGRFFRVSGYTGSRPPPDHALPVIIGATRPRMVRLAGERADGVHYNFIQSIPWLEETAVPALADGVERSGRALADLDRSTLLFIVVTDDAEGARDGVRHSLVSWLRTPYFYDWLSFHGFHEEGERGASAIAQGDMVAAEGAMTDPVVDAIAVIGTSEECRQRVAQYTSLVDWVALVTPPGLPTEQKVGAVRRLIRTFATS